MLLRARRLISSLLFRAMVLAVGGVVSTTILLVMVGISLPVKAQKNFQQRNMEIEMGIRFQDMDRRVTALENMNISAVLAELKTSADYNKTLQIGILIAVLGVLGERLANLVKRETPSPKAKE